MAGEELHLLASALLVTRSLTSFGAHIPETTGPIFYWRACCVARGASRGFHSAQHAFSAPFPFRCTTYTHELPRSDGPFVGETTDRWRASFAEAVYSFKFSGCI